VQLQGDVEAEQILLDRGDGEQCRPQPEHQSSAGAFTQYRTKITSERSCKIAISDLYIIATSVVELKIVALRKHDETESLTICPSLQSNVSIPHRLGLAVAIMPVGVEIVLYNHEQARRTHADVSAPPLSVSIFASHRTG
jgi:hypothetical protein